MSLVLGILTVINQVDFGTFEFAKKEVKSFGRNRVGMNRVNT